MTSKKKQPVFFLSHGGGPWPWLKKEMPYFEKLEQFLIEIPKTLPEVPKAIIVISGHWEEKEFTVMGNPNPPMVYDYFGFPEFTYHIDYPSSGDPDLALKIKKLLNEMGMVAEIDHERGYDHGVYSILYPMYPSANVPVIQISLKSSFDPEEHIQMGKSIASLREEGVLILGSGNSYHNMKMPLDGIEHSNVFDQWLQNSLTIQDEEERKSKIIHWENAPFARKVQPREDHFMPLMVALGAGLSDSTSVVYEDRLLGKFAVSGFRFG
ncbi:MAG: dioxygenase [Bdellovibrionaceae bacterium]|nr:dioxygenase [Pseudobdellovibrionaceae bacterium]|tara:strand:- start:920 stop:1720 length:801 start_codon:yes stop_codon:yes gene_type:complete